MVFLLSNGSLNHCGTAFHKMRPAGIIPLGKKMGVKAYSWKILHWVAATAAAVLTTVLLDSLRASSTTAGMVFLVLVVWLAAQSGTALSIYAAVLCAVSFDYFFLPPVRTLRIEGVQAWVAMLSFVASCFVVNRVAERARRQTQRATQRQADLERLYELSQEMMLFEDAEKLLQDLPRVIGRIFNLEGVVLYVGDQDRFYSSTGETPASVQAHMKVNTQGLNPTMTPLAGYHITPLMLGLRSIGALAWRPGDFSHEVAIAVSAQVSIAVARSIAMETAARIEAAREGERLRTALIDSLTHELRTPLTSIRAAASTLLQADGLDEAGRQEMARIIDEEAARLDLLIGESVEMAEIDADVVQVKMSQQHPRALLDEAAEESRKILASHKTVIVSGDPQGAAGDDPAWFDPKLLGRVLRHLLENAAAHTPPGTRVTLSSRRSGDRLEFCVEDNGPGIDALDLPLIFEKFYRGKRGAGKRKGSGMGLAITRAILAAHGGGIEATSTPGNGVRFRFWVPLVEKEPSARP
jgi:two-component system sensor histidine kinase KdpD